MEYLKLDDIEFDTEFIKLGIFNICREKYVFTEINSASPLSTIIIPKIALGKWIVGKTGNLYELYHIDYENFKGKKKYITNKIEFIINSILNLVSYDDYIKNINKEVHLSKHPFNKQNINLIEDGIEIIFDTKSKRKFKVIIETNDHIVIKISIEF
jgi:hypothetical protein